MWGRPAFVEGGHGHFLTKRFFFNWFSLKKLRKQGKNKRNMNNIIKPWMWQTQINMKENMSGGGYERFSVE